MSWDILKSNFLKLADEPKKKTYSLVLTVMTILISKIRNLYKKKYLI